MDGSRPRIGFIGAGRVATALAVALDAAGYPVGAVASLTFDSARDLASRLSSCRSCASPQDVVDSCELVFLAVPDEAIRSVSEALVWRIGVAAVHTSGALSREALASAEAQGASTGSLHPLQTFADRDQASRNLTGSVFGVEAEDELAESLLAIVAALGGTPILLRAEDKALYHAAAVLASNYVVTLMKLATDLWLRLGWERSAATQALLPLLKGAVANIEAVGLPAALTGPIARGDVETVERHLAALAEAAPELLPAYRDLAIQTIPVALAKGGLTEEATTALRAALARIEQGTKSIQGPGGMKWRD